jgi:hypothetical protein
MKGMNMELKMTDDIVKRMREALKHEDRYQMTMAPEFVSAIADTLEKQADEIKRLKAELEEHKTPQRIGNTNRSLAKYIKGEF